MNWEIITFLGYFVILLGVALIFYFNGSNKNSEDFFLGGRSTYSEMSQSQLMSCPPHTGHRSASHPTWW